MDVTSQHAFWLGGHRALHKRFIAKVVGLDMRVCVTVAIAGKITNKADMFSFGVVLWEIITLERPMWRGNLREIRWVTGDLC